MKRRSFLGVLGWLAVAALTTVTSTWAISLLGQGLSQRVVAPMSPTQVARALAGATAVPPGALPTAASTGAGRPFNTEGGSVVATCEGDQAVLQSWSPAQGFGTDDVDRGPAGTASIEFESEETKVTVKVTCRGGVPAMTSGREHD